MTIKTDYGVTGSLVTPGAFNPENDYAGGSFAGHLEEQVAEAGKVGDAGKDRRGHYARDVAGIESEDFTGYFKELQAERMEALREEILEAMGITEEALARMAPEQRAAIENIVTRQIQERLAAESIMKDGDHGSANQAIFGQAIQGNGGGLGFSSAIGEPAGSDPFSITDEDDKV